MKPNHTVYKRNILSFKNFENQILKFCGKAHASGNYSFKKTVVQNNHSEKVKKSNIIFRYKVNVIYEIFKNKELKLCVQFPIYHFNSQNNYHNDTSTFGVLIGEKNIISSDVTNYSHFAFLPRIDFKLFMNRAYSGLCDNNRDDNNCYDYIFNFFSERIKNNLSTFTKKIDSTLSPIDFSSIKCIGFIQNNILEQEKELNQLISKKTAQEKISLSLTEEFNAERKKISDSIAEIKIMLRNLEQAEINLFNKFNQSEQILIDSNIKIVKFKIKSNKNTRINHMASFLHCNKPNVIFNIAINESYKLFNKENCSEYEKALDTIEFETDK